METNAGHVQVPLLRVMLHDLSSLDCILNTPSSTSVMFDFGLDLALSIFSIQRL